MATTADDDGLFVATPERVGFSYRLAGLGSRAVAQLVDLAILCGATAVLLTGTVATGMSPLAVGLVLVLGAFVLTNGYYIFFEGLWSGQTPGKRVMRLRAVAGAGQPITFEQSLARNLVRIVDFLPLFYGVGVVTMFINGRGKRLGDMAAGTVVVRERSSVTLASLVATAEARLAQERADPRLAASAAAAANAAYVRDRALRDLEPALRDFVVAYAGRRPWLSPAQRAAFAEAAGPGLARVLPAVVRERGPLSALDQLADLAAAVSPGASSNR